MSGEQRTLAQFHRHIGFQTEFALRNGLQTDTPEQVALIACVNPHDLMLKAPSSPSSSGSQSSPRKSGASSPYHKTPLAVGKRSLDVIATRESVKADYVRQVKYEAKHRPMLPLPYRPSGCIEVPQTLVLDKTCVVLFYNRGRLGVPQSQYENLGTMEDPDTPFTLEGEKRITFVLAWPGYKETEFSLSLRKQDETTLLATKRPICRSELASDILFFVTSWFHNKVLGLEDSRPDYEAPKRFGILKTFPDVQVSDVWLTRFGPVKGGDGSRWMAELYIPQIPFVGGV